MPPAIAMTGAGVVGATLGSFLNVVAYRMPRRESVVMPRSRCTSCGSLVRPRDNVPIFSWLLLRGRCRDCHAHISARYPIVEAATAALLVGVVADRHDAAGIALGVICVLLLVPCALIDLDHRIIPNRLTGPGALVAIAVGTALDPSGEPTRLIAGAAAGGFLLLAALAYPRGMGMGDVKLAGMIGLFLGEAVAPAVFIALLAGLGVGVVLSAHRGVAVARKTAIPFGPFLALGGLVALFAGMPLVHLYVNHFVH